MDRATVEPTVTEMPGARARRWADYHQSVAAPSTHLYDFVWDHRRDAVGPFCTDVDGNVLLDFTSHVAAAPLGYDNPELRERLDAFGAVDPLKIAGQDFYAAGGWPPEDPDLPGPTQLMHRLADLTADYGLDTVFLSNSGAEAVENAIKVCYARREGAKYAITFDGAFHGRTLGALSLNRSKAIHRRGFPELAGVTAMPYCEDRTCTAATCDCGFFVGDGTSRLRDAFGPEGAIDPDEVAYVIFEPIQGESGYRVPSEAFVAELGSVCREYGVPLVADEVQTGLGRTGEWWGVDHYDADPDVVAAGKALRVGATVANRETFPAEKARLSSTWGAGDLLSSLVGALTIDVIREEGLLTNARVRGEALRDRLAAADPPFVLDVRGKGLLVGVEFDARDRRDAVVEACLHRGLLTLPGGHRTLRLLPPLDVTEREIEMGATLLLDAISDPAVRRASPHPDAGDEAS
ncbi:MAG: aspartate aminotransferase family protein [Haloplanus sp.]